MKITKHQLRRIIRNSLLKEGWGQKPANAAEYAPTLDAAIFGAEETLKMADYRRSRAAEDPELEDMFIQDAEDLESIVSQFEYEVQKGAAPGEFSQELQAKMSRLDTAVREEIHADLWWSVFSEQL